MGDGIYARRRGRALEAGASQLSGYFDLVTRRLCVPEWLVRSQRPRPPSWGEGKC